MATFLDRYRHGEYEQVWSELLRYGVHIRQEPLFSDALDVARETMIRAKENIDRIVARLIEIEYNFIYPEYVVIPAKANILEDISQLEQAAGMLPISLRVWYEIVGSVCLIGNHSTLSLYASGLFDAPPSIYSDPLVVESIESVLREYIIQFPDEAARAEIEAFRLPIAPDMYHKANVSGGAPYEVAIPHAAIDSPLLNEEHNTTFVNYLRMCFRWGGFPGFERYPVHERPTELLAFLANDLLPL